MSTSPLRRAVERRSATALVALRRIPRWALPLATAAVLLLGLAGPRWVGAAALLALASFLAWLCFLSWPALQATGRLLRVVAILAVLAVAVLRALGNP